MEFLNSMKGSRKMIAGATMLVIAVGVLFIPGVETDKYRILMDALWKIAVALGLANGMEHIGAGITKK